jgi:hypothetical protein
MKRLSKFEFEDANLTHQMKLKNIYPKESVYAFKKRCINCKRRYTSRLIKINESIAEKIRESFVFNGHF